MALNQVRGIYTALPLRNEHDIRLLQIDSNSTDGISCHLVVTNLNSQLSYIALSYTWGPATPAETAKRVTNDRVRPIKCNGESILVTENLHAFLVRAKASNLFRDRHLWIDFLCIDQSNEAERSSQVMRMATIYNSAEFVVVWLGEEDEYTKPSFDLIRKLALCSEESLGLITPNRMRSPEVLRLLEPCGDVSYWTSLKQLFERHYFNRAWIIQEVSLAKEILTLCGQHTIKWEDVIAVSRFLTVTSWTRWICPLGVVPQGDTHQSHHALPNILAANKRTKLDGEKDLMLYSLIRFRRFKSGDARDKVYALLGVCGDADASKPGFTPIYDQRTAAATFTSAAIQILEDSNELLLLAHAEGTLFQTVQPQLPSWVPDWSCNCILGLGVTGYKRFFASGDMERSLTIDRTALTLTVKGFMLDHVKVVGETKREVLEGGSFKQWLAIFRSMSEVYYTMQPRMEAFWRTLITDTSESPPLHPASPSWGGAFSQWMSSKLAVQDERSAESLIVMAELPVQPATRTSGHVIDKSNDAVSSHTGSKDTPPFTVESQAYETTFSHAPHLQLFLTEKGYLGLGSESLAEHDSVWIIAGSRVPLLLRKASPGSFQVVGGAYVHGFMHGQALKLGYTSQNIILR